MKRLYNQGLKYIHILAASFWVGGVLALIIVLLFTNPVTPEELYLRSVIAKLIDDILIIPGGVTILVTGIIYGIWTKWGFLKHRWITLKWIITIFMVVLGAFALGSWVNNNVYSVSEINKYANTQNEFNLNVSKTIFWSIVQFLCLIVTLWISIKKPWRKKRNIS